MILIHKPASRRLANVAPILVTLAIASCSSVPSLGLVSPSPSSGAQTASAAAPTPATSPISMSCDPVPDVPVGSHALACLSAVNAAIEALPPGHSPVASAVFHYYCPAGADCAVWLFGVVEIKFAIGAFRTATVRVAFDPQSGHVQASLVP